MGIRGRHEMEIRQRNKEKQRRKEEKAGGFKCSHCRQWVPFHELMGTAHRDHCPHCGRSKHVDLKKPGDRKSKCQAGMESIGLTFKREGVSRYGSVKQGEIMLIHQCTQCDKISINRIAADDSPVMVEQVLEKSQRLGKNIKNRLEKVGIKLLGRKDGKEIKVQLYGKI